MSRHEKDKTVQELVSAGEYTVGSESVTKILMCRDGAGPMGWYDVIHVFFGPDEEPGISMPAHMTTGWS